MLFCASVTRDDFRFTCPRFPLVSHDLDAFRMSGSEVGAFSPVVGEVVQFPVVVASRDEFPIADANGLVAFMLPIQGPVAE